MLLPVVSVLPALVVALDNGVGLTPAMGWSSWNHLLGNVNESILLEAAETFLRSGLKDAGYEYINLDDGWAVGRDNASGRLLADPVKFPRGLKYVADQIHASGLKFGLYTARGSVTCMGRPGSDGHEELDAATFAEWGVDYLKEDSCGGLEHGTIWEQYVRMRDALNRTGRPIYFSVTQQLQYDDNRTTAMRCPYAGVFTVKPWLEAGLDPRRLANAYLVEFCNNFDYFGFTAGIPNFGGFLSNLDAQQLLTYDNMTERGAYNDNDMLQVCNGGQTIAEYRAQFSTWAILASPLILGNDIARMSSDCASIVLNKEVIAINQDRLVSRGRLVYQWPDRTWPGEPPRRRGGDLRGGSPSPPVVAAVGVEPCRGTAGAPSQRFIHNDTDGTLRLASTGQCLTYLGYREANLFVTECNAWSEREVGGQTWSIRNDSIFVRNVTEKCLDVFNCDVGGHQAAQVCTCIAGGHWEDDCFAAGAGRQTCGGLNLRWRFDLEASLRGGSVISTAVDGYRSCLTAEPLPDGWVHIELQVWARPLSDGSVALVAFNRGGLVREVDIDWAWLGEPSSRRLRARDLWAHQDLGVFDSRLSVRVEPHDVRALRFFPAEAAAVVV